MQHGQQIRKVDVKFCGIAKADHHETFVRGGNVAGNKRVRGIHRGNPLKVDVGPRELGRNKVNVIVHAAQNCFSDGFGRITAALGVTVNFLDPLEVDNGNHSHEQVHMLCNVDRAVDHASMQSLVEE